MNRFRLLLLIGILICALTGAQHNFGQERAKPKLKDFGASLKRLRWDSNQNAAVESKSKQTAKGPVPDDVVRVETSLVMNDVLVLDGRGQAVVGLTAKDFVITEDGSAQQVGMFALGDNATVPRSIVLIIDYGCLELPFVKTSVTAAMSLVDKLAPEDRMAIVTDDVELLSDFTNDKRKLKENLYQLIRRTSTNIRDQTFVLERFNSGQPPFGRGFQYSALMAVLKELFNGEDERPIVIFQSMGSEASLLRNSIITDGVEPGLPKDLQAEAKALLRHRVEYSKRNPREFSLNDLYQAAERSRTTIYSIVPGVQFVGLRPEELAPQMRNFLLRSMAGFDVSSYRKQTNDYLKRAGDEALTWDAQNLAKLQSGVAVLSTITGGWTEFLSEPEQADQIYSRILADINRRYLIGYYPTNKSHDGKRRKVNIAVQGHPEYIVMAHKAYYAPPSDQ